MGNIIKSFLDLSGDTIDKLTNLDIGNLAILLPIENILEDRVSGSIVLGETDKKEKDYFITAEGKILGSRETNDTAYVYITTETAKKEVEEKIVAQITFQEDRLDPTVNLTTLKWNLLIKHSDTKLLQFKNSPTSEPFNLPYSYFKRFVGVIYGEMGYFVRDINEARAIGCCIINAIQEHQRWKTNEDLNNLERFDRFLRPNYTFAPNDPPYKKIMQISLERIVKRIDMNIAFVAALDALISYNLNGETDYANGYSLGWR